MVAGTTATIRGAGESVGSPIGNGREETARRRESYTAVPHADEYPQGEVAVDTS